MIGASGIRGASCMWVDAASNELVAAAVTTNDLGDGHLLLELLDQINADIVQVSGDGAYDTGACYAAICARQAQAVIPPTRGARTWQRGNSIDPPLARDKNLRYIRRSGCALETEAWLAPP
jgi:Transposase DDE domain